MKHIEHIGIAFILCFIGFFIAMPLASLVTDFIIPSQVGVYNTSFAEHLANIKTFSLYSGLFMAAFYMLNIWQRKQNTFKLHFLASMFFSAIVIFVTMLYYRLKVQQFDQIMTDLSKSIPSISRSVPSPDISMIPLMGLIFIVFYFCLRLFFVTRNKGCCNNI